VEYRAFHRYLVSEKGDVLNSRTLAPMVHTITKKGYHVIGLLVNGKQKFIRVHRLVAHLWLDLDLESDDQVDHIDGTTDNNHWTNLQALRPSQHNAITHARAAVRLGDTQDCKVCRQCRVKKLRREFYSGPGADGLGSYCMVCDKLRRQRYR
jgi:hypothetical protein